MRAILDTSVVLSEGIEHIDAEIAISAITLAELNFGVLVAKDHDIRAERLRRLLAVQRLFDAIPVDDRIAESYGRIASAVVDAGRKPRGRSLDLMIAATAHAYDARLYTRNAADFLGLDQLIEVVSL